VSHPEHRSRRSPAAAPCCKLRGGRARVPGRPPGSSWQLTSAFSPPPRVMSKHAPAPPASSAWCSRGPDGVAKANVRASAPARFDPGRVAVTVGKECRQPPIDQLALCGRWAGCSVAAAGHRASCHQRWTTRHRRRRRGGRAPPASRAWAACCRRSVMRWSASTWLSPACWLFMSLPFLQLSPACFSPECPADRGAGPIPSASRIAPRPWQALLAVREGRRQQANGRGRSPARGSCSP
jgi:hypothetical protein